MSTGLVDADAPPARRFEPGLRAEAPMARADGGEGYSRIVGAYYMRFADSGRPLLVEVGIAEEGGFTAFSPLLSLGGTGSTRERAMSDLAETAIWMWQDFHATPPEQLDESATQYLRLAAPLRIPTP